MANSAGSVILRPIGILIRFFHLTEQKWYLLPIDPWMENWETTMTYGW